MPEKELVHWFFTVAFPIIVSGASFYAASKGRTANLEHRLTEIEAKCNYQEKELEEHTQRLNKHDEE